MDKEQRLNADEVMCLQMAGIDTPQIMGTSLDTFDLMYDENEETYARYLERANKILDTQEKLGIITISCHDDRFHDRLRAIGVECPPLVYCLGNISLLDKDKAVAVIGARAADRPGNHAAYSIARHFANEGFVIVSGLALGCDTSAHRASIDVNGETIAIVATGLDRIHPHESEQLQHDILSHGGLILSEQPLGIKANPTRLVARNRLQAALSQMVILAQCPARSGSLHTMRFARKYHKKCAAAQFRVWTDASAGNQDLIMHRLASPIFVNDSNTIIDLSDISAEEPGQQYADFSKTTGKSR